MSYSIDLIDAYRGNPLIAACGDILNETELALRLSRYPSVPQNMTDIPFELRRHMVPSLRQLHIASPEGIRIAHTIDVTLRQGYVARKPGTSSFFDGFYHNPPIISQQIAAAVVGMSGSGKTAAIESSLNIIPVSVVHEKMPGFVSSFKQLLWIKIDAPESGKLVDLASNLMEATDLALGTQYFKNSLKKERKVGSEMFREWLGIAKKHVLGLIVIEEIQNLFKLDTLKERRKRKKDDYEKSELRIVEDVTLKLLLTVTNTWRIPIMIAGTHDGLAAFKMRFSTSQRLATDGYHEIHPPLKADDKIFSEIIFPTLVKYQWVNQKLPNTDEFRQLVFDLSLGIPRIYINLWIAAHRVCFDRKEDSLTFQHFKEAFNKYLHPLIPALNALRSNDPYRIARYEDLYPRGQDFWGGL